MSAYEINSWFGREICNHGAKMLTAPRKHSLWKHGLQLERVLHRMGLLCHAHPPTLALGWNRRGSRLPRQAIRPLSRIPMVRSILERSTLLEAQCFRVIKRLQETGPSISVDPVEYLPSANTHYPMLYLPTYIKSPLHAAVVIHVPAQLTVGPEHIDAISCCTRRSAAPHVEQVIGFKIIV